MRNLFRTLAAATLLVVSARAAEAGTVTVHFNNGGTTTAFGYYVGPYNGTVNGKPVTLNCVDFFHHVTTGQTWTANVTTGLGNSNVDLSATRWGSIPNALDVYRKAAFLTTQYAGKSSSEVADIQATIWGMFGKPGSPAPSSNYWMQYANQHYMDNGVAYYNNVQILSDVNKGTGSAQEMIIVTPEPASMLLMGTGLAAFGAARRRKQKKEKDAEA